MGIQTRDYMKRPSDADERSETTDDQLEGFLTSFLLKHPRFLLYVGIVLVGLILIAILVAKLTG